MGDSMNKAKDIYTTGLSNQHAVEMQAVETIERQLGRLDEYPDLTARMKQELDRSKTQAQRLERLLEQHGTKASATKEAVTSLIGKVSGVAHLTASDEVIKDLLAAIGFKAYEIASYQALVTMAEEAGAAGDVATLKQSMAEESEMAEWHTAHLPGIVRSYLQRSMAG